MRRAAWVAFGALCGWAWAREVIDSRKPPPSGITERQAEILDLVARGMSSKEIARHAGITEHSVNTHIRRATRTLGVGSRTAAAVAMSGRSRQAGTPSRPRRSATAVSAATTSATSSSNGT